MVIKFQQMINANNTGLVAPVKKTTYLTKWDVKKTSDLIFEVLVFANKPFFSHSQITKYLSQDRMAIRKILIALVKSKWLVEFKEGTQIYYIRKNHSPTALFDFLQKTELDENGN